MIMRFSTVFFELSLLSTAALAANPACVDPATEQNGKNLEQFLTWFNAEVISGWNEVIKNDENFHAWVQKQKTCQHDCMGKVLNQTGYSLWSSGNAFADEGKAYAEEAITSAMKACYPDVPRDAFQPLTKQVVASMTTSRRLEVLDHPLSWHSLQARVLQEDPLACNGPEEKGFLGRKIFLNNFQHKWPTAFATVQEKKGNEKLKEFFADWAKDCQTECHEAAQQEAMKTLWDDGLAVNGEYMAQALMGAMLTCYPKIPVDEAEKAIRQALEETMNIEDEPTFLADFKKSVDQGWAQTMANDPEIENWMDMQQDCQETCWDSMWDEVARTLYAADLLVQADGKKLLQESIVGAFRACYPEAPRKNILPLAETVASHVEADLMKTTERRLETHPFSRRLQENHVCENHTHPCSGPLGSTTEERERVLNVFKEDFPKAMSTVINSHAGVKKFFTENKYSGQHDCGNHAISLTIDTLWDSGTIVLGDSAIQTALTAALKACFPRVPNSDMKQLVGMMVDEFNGKDATRLFEVRDTPAEGALGKLRSGVSALSVPLLVVFAAVGGAILGRRTSPRHMPLSQVALPFTEGDCVIE